MPFNQNEDYFFDHEGDGDDSNNDDSNNDRPLPTDEWTPPVPMAIQHETPEISVFDSDDFESVIADVDTSLMHAEAMLLHVATKISTAASIMQEIPNHDQLIEPMIAISEMIAHVRQGTTSARDLATEILVLTRHEAERQSRIRNLRGQ